MMVLASSNQYMFIPLDGPEADYTGYPVFVALKPLGSGEPEAADWKGDAVWLAPRTGQPKEIAWQPPGTWGESYAPGEYMAYARITASPEDVPLISGRVRIGDTRS